MDGRAEVAIDDITRRHTGAAHRVSANSRPQEEGRTSDDIVWNCEIVTRTEPPKYSPAGKRNEASHQRHKGRQKGHKEPEKG